MSAHSNGTTVEYSTNSGSSYTAFANEVVSIEPTGGSTTASPRGHLNSSNALHVTEPGARQAGTVTFNFRVETATDADWDEYQLVLGWWTARTEGLYFKIKYPKASGDSVNPNAVLVGYISQQPVLTSPEDGPMEYQLVIQLTADPTLTDGGT